MPGLVLGTCFYIINYLIVSSKQLYKLEISDRGGTIYLVLQQRVAGNEIRLADMYIRARLLSHFRAASPGSRAKLWPNGCFSQTDVLRSKIVQQKDYFPAKCFIWQE